MLETLITDAVSSSAHNKLWELMVFILKSFSHLNFDGTHWSDTVCRADKAKSVAKSLAILQECFRQNSLCVSEEDGACLHHSCRFRAGRSDRFSASLRTAPGAVPRVTHTRGPRLPFQRSVPTWYRLSL